jgi:hypothetical protein
MPSKAPKGEAESSVFANWLATAGQTFVKSLVLVRRGRKARMLATSAVVAALSELMALM